MFGKIKLNSQKMSNTNPAVVPHKVGTCFIKADGNTEEEINYVLTVIQIQKPDEGGNINFELSSIDYENKKLNYSYEYTNGQPNSENDIKTFILPIFMPHLKPGSTINDKDFFVPNEVEVVNLADSSKKKKGTVTTSNPTHLDKTLETINSPRVKVASSTYSNNGTETLTYFIMIMNLNTSKFKRNLSIHLDPMYPTTILCENTLDENPPETEVNRASIAVLRSDVNAEYENVQLGGTTTQIPTENGGYKCDATFQLS